MNDIEVIAQFRNLVAEFKQKEECLVEAIKNSNFDDPAFEAIDSLVIEIKEKLSQHDILRVDDLLLRNDLAAIRENKGFYFEFLELLKSLRKNGDAKNAGGLKFAPDWEKFYETRWWDILSDEILSQADPYTLIMRKMELGPLLVGKTLPQHLKNHLARIKECYAWGFDPEAAIYCRTILEEGFREALKSKAEFSTPQQRRDLEGWSLEWLLNHSKKKKYFYVEVIKKAYKLKENVNHIVHPTSARKPDVQISNLEIIKDTFYILEMLFR
jgi:hypothetical protein